VQQNDSSTQEDLREPAEALLTLDVASGYACSARDELSAADSGKVVAVQEETAASRTYILSYLKHLAVRATDIHAKVDQEKL
jgi:hypothetical protein